MEESKEKDATNKPASMWAQHMNLWKNSNYVLLWVGQTISSLGSGISQLAYPLLTLAITGSPAQAGIVSALKFAVLVLLSLPAGALIDRWDRKKAMIICDTGRMLCLASIPIAAWIGHLTITQLYITALLEGTFYVFFSVAQVASLPQMVTKEQLPEAMSQNQVSTSSSALLGPSLGGVLFSLGRTIPFLFDAISYLASVISLFFIKTQFQLQRNTRRKNLRQEILEGFTWTRGQPVILAMAMISAGINLVLPASTLIIIVQAQQQHASSQLIGFIFGIGGIGSVFGAVYGSSIKRRFKFSTIIITVSWAFACLWIFFIVYPYPLVLGIIYAGIMLLAPIYNITLVSYRLSLTPDEYQGRVNSVARLFAMGVVPINQLLTGFFLQWFNVTPTVLIFLAALLILSVIVTLNPTLRQVGVSQKETPAAVQEEKEEETVLE